MTTADLPAPPSPDRAAPQDDEPRRVVGGVLLRRDLVKEDGRRLSFYDSAPPDPAPHEPRST